ncbi:uncharacterized protein E0L32_010741 [Thyridium curvatum]|uniref:Uncharacterized protein n=1 Tax=Thyridium curvatum TaxID=1093900 RepID=A0A507AQZ9_9PEZI|nr:uncharacterized protein E0L32_010741 [Thyridium curvatum]TPX07319.1 hypothetical protein E0L32_010741 [Thyridium curvatum]
MQVDMASDLLINYLGGERSLIIATHGREPVHHLWPLNYVLPPVDISDPYTFLGVKRGILQYAWLKPILALAAIIMKATGVYQEGYIGLNSGYFWSGLAYNASVTISLYSLALFWVCMHEDLKPFRPVPKFLCIKLIIFASYWQGFFLSILVWLGAIPDNVQGYTPDNLAAAIQDALICIEMPGFAIAHWYAFSWHDFADNRVSAARMPVKYALRDAFGPRDLIEDTKETFTGNKYGYRLFDSGDKIMAHEASKSRLARVQAGMRYERGGKGKYWIPKPDEINAEINPYTPLLGSRGGPSRANSQQSNGALEETQLDQDDENLYENARKLEYGDWNYPVIPANDASRERWTPRPSSYQSSSRASGSYFPASTRMDEGGQRSAEGQAVKPSKKGKQKERGSTSAGPPRSPGGTLRPGLQVDDKPDLSEIDFDVSKGKSPEPSVHENVSSPGMEETRQWKEHDVTPVNVSPRYDVDEEEEFRNVWGGGESSARAKHL